MTFFAMLLDIAVNREIDVNALDHEGRTPFHLMCMTRCAKETKAFTDLANGKFSNLMFDLQKRDYNGETPEDLARKRDMIEKRKQRTYEATFRTGTL